jgi:hypothetical protein
MTDSCAQFQAQFHVILTAFVHPAGIAADTLITYRPVNSGSAAFAPLIPWENLI